MRRDAQKAADFAERHRVPFVTTDANALIAREDVDAVYIATPPAMHVEYALAVCAARKPCLVEKPVGRSDVECARVVDAFAQAGVPLWVSYYRRHLPKFRKVKELLDSGRIGRVVSIDYRLSKPAKDDAWRLEPGSSGGGRFYDLGGHVLDLLDDWFGPLALTGSAVSNVIPGHETEDAVALTFTTDAGAIGSAQWNFAAAENVDELVIDGLFGRIRLEGMSVAGAVLVELSNAAAVRSAGNVVARAVAQVRARVNLPVRERLRFAAEPLPYQALFESIARDVRASRPASPVSALRTSRLQNAALREYYGGRSDAFWQAPERYASLRARASRRATNDKTYVLSEEQVAFFNANGYLGPLRCDADWKKLVVPVSKGRNLHLSEPEVFDVCTHPSVVNRVAQLMGRPDISLFKSRFVVKLAGHNEEVAWHQDVGTTNGGYYSDGRPVPTISCWLALDRVNSANGAVQAIPGSQRVLTGDYRKKIRAELVERGDLTGADLAKAVTFDLEPGEFYIFHSWILHGSEANDSPGRRAGLNMRYAARGDECEADSVYIPLECATTKRPDADSRPSVALRARST